MSGLKCGPRAKGGITRVFSAQDSALWFVGGRYRSHTLIRRRPGFSLRDTMGDCGNGDLKSLVDTVSCLNEDQANGHVAKNAVLEAGDMSFLQSDEDTDSQLLLTIKFMSPIKLYSLKFTVPDGCPADNYPKSVKIFNTADDTMDFGSAEDSEGVQTLEIIPGEEMQVRFVKYQNVYALQMFIDGSVGGLDVPTKIKGIGLCGQPAAKMDMKDWKPIKG